MSSLKPLLLPTCCEPTHSLCCSRLLQELATISDTFAPVPSARLFADFCAARVVGKLPLAVAGVLRDKVLALVPDSQGVRSPALALRLRALPCLRCPRACQCRQAPCGRQHVAMPSDGM